MVLLALAGLPFGALAWADHDASGRVPEGVTIGGVDVGGLQRDTAVKRLRAEIGIPAQRGVKVAIAGADVKSRLSARRAGVSVDLESAVDRAVDRGRSGSFLTRGWRELTGAELASSEPVRPTVDRVAVKKFVDGLASEVAIDPQEASLSIAVESVSVSDSEPGRRLADPDKLVTQIVRSLKHVNAKRRPKAQTETVEPKVSQDSIWDEHPTVVTVSGDNTLVRLFDRGEVVKTYRVAVGSDEYPTPQGTFAVQTMQVDPSWNVPNSEWAGDLAGQTIPGGDPANPLKARWIGFDGSVGFHGTADAGSLGSAASHGCVRMAPADVIDLYKRVQPGTPVFVGA